MSTRPIGLACIDLPEKSVEYALRAMLGGEIGQSAWVEKFEKAVAEFAGSRYCIATANGTMADAVAVGAMKIKHRYDRAVVPALTFVAHPNSVLHNGLGIEFVDIGEDFGLDWNKALEWRGKAFFFPSDCLGRISVPPEVGLPVLEDACEAFGSIYQGRRAGRFGEMGAFSFFVSHSLTTGEGGAIVTDDDWLAGLCRSLRNHGTSSASDNLHKFECDWVGFNGKMSGLAAAVGLGAMEQAHTFTQIRRQRGLQLDAIFGNLRERPGEFLTPHAYPIQFDGEARRNEAIVELGKLGIECRRFFSCIPTMERAYRDRKQMIGRYPRSEHVAYTYLYVPCHQGLSSEDMVYIAQAVKAQKGVVL